MTSHTHDINKFIIIYALKYMLNQLTFNPSLNLCLIKLSKAMKLEMTKKNRLNKKKSENANEGISIKQEAMDN